MTDKNAALRPASRGAGAVAETVKRLYQAGQTDYYLEPIVLVDEDDQPLGRIRDGDSVIFCCRRGEREIQLTEAFTAADFDHFPRPAFSDLSFVILTLYHEKFRHLPIAFSPGKIAATLGEIVSQAGLHQLRVAESEKFAHVTVFLNGGRELPFEGEDHLCIPSPKGIAYDQVPGLSLPQVSRAVLEGIQKGYDWIVANFANGDVIGHTSNDQAKLACAGIVDRHLGLVLEAARAGEYAVLVTADHGNLEELITPAGKPHVSHTTNLVPLILVDPRPQAPQELSDGKLADIAPTILALLGLEKPALMEGKSLILDQGWSRPKRVLLVILDGWGLGSADKNNPIWQAETPVWDDLLQRCPQARLQASGEAVGLKPAKSGNSEAGHLNIGAGRVVLQDDVRLDQALQDGSFFTNPVFIQELKRVKQRNTNLHLIALLTEKSSHGSVDYPLALLKLAQEYGLERVYLHLIFDGRSTEPGTAPELLASFAARVDQIGLGQIVTGVGRGLALDRDGNYQKTRQAFDALVSGIGAKAIWR